MLESVKGIALQTVIESSTNIALIWIPTNKKNSLKLAPLGEFRINAGKVSCRYLWEEGEKNEQAPMWMY